MGRILIRLLAILGGLVVVAAIAFAFLVGAYRAPTESMKPTVGVGDRFLVLKLGSPGVGDVVVATPPRGALDSRCGEKPVEGRMCARPTPDQLNVKLVKRIVAVGGDRIALRGGRVLRNGRPETTRGPRPCSGDGCDFPSEIRVPSGHVFLMGDNRGASDDSRSWGPVPADWVVGRLWFVYLRA